MSKFTRILKNPLKVFEKKKKPPKFKDKNIAIETDTKRELGN